MSIQSLKHRIHKRMELQKYKQDYSDIGSFIKRKRKELNITQDEVSNGICSISYLSKIENNQIVPSSFYIQEIMDKLDIDEAIYSVSLRDKQYVSEMIQAFFYRNESLLESLYDDIKDVEHNVVINLCKLGYTVYHHLEDTNQYVMMLEHVVNNMTEEEIRLYLLFSALFFIDREDYKSALEFVLLQETLPQENPMINGLFKDVSYQVKVRLRMTISAADDYRDAMNIYQAHNNIKRSLELTLQKAQANVKEHPQKTLKMIDTIPLELLRQQNQDWYYYLKALALYNLDKYQDATLSLKSIRENSTYYMRKMTLLLRICQIECDDEMTSQIIAMLHQYQPNKQELTCKIYYHYLVEESDSQKQYLRDVAIPFSIRVGDYDKLEEYTNALMEICIEHARYKEATQHYNKYQKELSKIQKILYQKTP
ncbi:helix-turn-helix domain-containing protein [Candidatus Xianfuyuplasma coldseepsis]|uniref:Helix-turn-helix transcriptional regulator n=1 Tax=Candidatus Xianfuyuplasma coldseepsis TaxID=2782163 RepID=A0A7L7KRZ7_9MOLU|nr:helix-turn-helix transcriptional regulator [Xianfuyuplasma coldseepsis]QMS85591.1 helix-turn-helix transcriptional regulator [Xianfuyuplasma coldseepsis]